jgi:hypothetical protein
LIRPMAGMKSEAQLAESIDRFQKVFWEKQSAGRPPVGVVHSGIFLPIQYLRRAFPRAEVKPEDVGREGIMTDYEFGFAQRPVSCDDWMPFSAPWRGIPWLEAWCGCPVRFSTGSLAPEPAVASRAALAQAPLPAADEWFDCLSRQTRMLVDTAPADCWISPSILRGPSDVLAAMRGLTDFYCDLHDDISVLDQVAGRINQLLLRALDRHFSMVPPRRGGYGHIFGYWAPGKTVVIQEDVLGMCRPHLYRDIFRKYNAEVVRHLGAHVLFHLHSTGFQHYRDVLSIPGIAGLELTVEANGPSLLELVPVMREILERSRLILFVDHGFEQLPGVLRQLPRAGLYLVVLEQHVRTDDEFRRLVNAGWHAGVS